MLICAFAGKVIKVSAASCSRIGGIMTGFLTPVESQEVIFSLKIIANAYK